MPGNSGNSSREDRSDDAKAVFERLFRSGRLNGLFAWLVIGVLATVFLESALDLDYQWLVFVTGVGVVVLIPPAAYRDWRIMLPWELLVLATLPILVRGLFGGSVGTFAAYLAVAGLALLVTVELHMFTSLQVTQWFAVAFVVLLTLASVAAWTVLRWNLDRTFGTSYLSTNEVLMAEWLSVTVAGLAAGVLFDAYFRRRDRQLRRALRRVVRR
ncbi:hypothetical protein [Natrinema versiforme]|uniref:Uncharacterized protein n=1 Tax=Natrinema versiforme JCM 10478 TaxID=1227496 RepID=L9XSL2_9EURY|nr:hypothetical protein [Natrinema versiforme]ELY64497.1 hypothetical protein C489_17129 [Natrinema versiforme JCM 10478]